MTQNGLENIKEKSYDGEITILRENSSKTKRLTKRGFCQKREKQSRLQFDQFIEDTRGMDNRSLVEGGGGKPIQFNAGKVHFMDQNVYHQTKVAQKAVGSRDGMLRLMAGFTILHKITMNTQETV